MQISSGLVGRLRLARRRRVIFDVIADNRENVAGNRLALFGPVLVFLVPLFFFSFFFFFFFFVFFLLPSGIQLQPFLLASSFDWENPIVSIQQRSPYCTDFDRLQSFFRRLFMQIP